jgi:hypothetical protein
VEGYQATFGREPDLAVFQAAGGPVEFEI